MALLAIHSVNAATGCVHLACDVIDHMPSLLTLVIWEALSKLAFIAGWLVLLSYVASMGDLDRKEMTVDDKPLHGIRRRFHYSESEIGMLIVYVIAGIWGVELIGAVSNFAVAYGVTIWYFTECEHDNSKPEVSGAVGRGFLLSMRNHLGSLALGAVLVGPLGLLRTIIAYMVDQGCAAAHSGSISSALCKPFLCCFQCFDRFLVLLSRNAYIEIAIRSENFIPSAVRSVSVLGGEFHEVAILSGMTFVFSFLGTACITVFISVLVFLCTKNLMMFTSDASEWFVASPVFVAVATGLIACMVAVVFMSAFDMIADTVLYCNIVDKSEWSSKPLRPGETPPNYEPSALTRMVHSHGRVHARRAGRKTGETNRGKDSSKAREFSHGQTDPEFSRKATAPSIEGHLPQMQPESPGLGHSPTNAGGSKKQPQPKRASVLERIGEAVFGSGKESTQPVTQVPPEHDPMITRSPREMAGHSGDPAK